MPRRVAIPPELTAAPFPLAEGRRRGLTDSRQRGADLHRPFPGVRSTSESLTVQERCRAFAARMPPGQFFSHTTAASLHGLPLPRRVERPDSPLHVSVVEPGQSPRVRGVRGHRLVSATVIPLDGLRVVDPLRAWAQCASFLSVDELIVAGDRLMSRDSPLCTSDQLNAFLTALTGHRGVTRLRLARAELRVGSASPKETQTRLLLIRSGLPEPELNVRIFARDGRQIAIGDLVYPRFRVLVEYDGEQHRLDDRQYARDIERMADLAEEGWRVIRVLKHHLPSQTLLRVRRALTDAGWRP